MSTYLLKYFPLQIIIVYFVFFPLQIIWHRAKDMYILFTRWGRIGDTGQYQHTPYHKLSDAVVEFNKIFRAKTGNYWSSVKR